MKYYEEIRIANLSKQITAQIKSYLLNIYLS